MGHGKAKVPNGASGPLRSRHLHRFRKHRDRHRDLQHKCQVAKDLVHYPLQLFYPKGCVLFSWYPFWVGSKQKTIEKNR